MKKVALSLAGVLAAAAFAPEASAIPAFARQTGMACSACHAQHFPVLNGFGRAFKSAGFTMMGAQEKVEGEHLSLPAVMNAATLLKVRYQKSNGAAPATPTLDNTNSGDWQFPDEFSLFFGGRVADNGAMKVGMMMENNLANPGGALAAGLRVPVVFDMDSVKLSVIPFTTDALGAFYGYTESSTGVNRAIRWAEHRKEISAYQYTGIGNGANTGLAFVAHTDMGYINVSRFAPQFVNAYEMSSTAVELAFTPTIADFATVITVDALSGSSYDANMALQQTKGTGFSAQAHGELAGMETGLYATYSKTDATSMFGDKQAMTVAGDFTVIPHTLSLGLAIRSAKSAGVNDNATTVTAVYDLAQNVAGVVNFTKYSKVQGTNGDNLVTMMLEAAW